MNKILFVATYLFVGLQANNIMDGITAKNDSGTTLTDIGNLQDGNSNTSINSSPTYLIATLKKVARVKATVVVFSLTPTNSPVLSLGFDGIYLECKTLSYDSIFSCNGLAAQTVKLTSPQNVSEIYAYSWDVYSMNTLTGSVGSSTEATGFPKTNALTMDTQVWATSTNYFESNIAAPWWNVVFPNQIFVRRVVLFSKRDLNLQNVSVRFKNQNEAEHSSTVCSTQQSQLNFWVSFCKKTGDSLGVWNNSSPVALTLQYVGVIYQEASCAQDSECETVQNATYSQAALPLVMAGNPTTIALDSVYNNSCCPVTVSIDSTNEVTGATIDWTTQDIKLAPTANTYHSATTATLKFKLLYFDGDTTKESSVLTRSVNITCVAAVAYKIDNFEQISVFTTDAAVITTKDYATCLGGGTVTVTCDQTTRPGYAVVSQNQITMDFTKRVSTQFVDQNYFVKCTHTSTSGQYYLDEYQVDSIDCSKGLQTPNPALTLDTQTIELNTQQNFIIQKPLTTKTITVSAFAITQVPAIYGKQCGALSYTIKAPSETNITITKLSPTTFELNLSSYTRINSQDTVDMKLKIKCAQFASDIEFSFPIEIQICQASTSSTSYDVFYLIDGVSQTVQLPLQNSSSFCFPISYTYFDTSATQQSIPSWLTFGQVANVPTMQIQLSDKTKKGKYRVSMEVPTATPISVDFILYLGELIEPSYLFGFSALQGTTPWLTDVTGNDFTQVFKWSVDDSQTNAQTRFPITYAMSIDGTNIDKTKDDSSTNKGMNLTIVNWHVPSGQHVLGWRIFTNKSNLEGLQLGSHNMVLTVSVSFITISSTSTTRTFSLTKTFTLTLKSCTDSTHFSEPTAPSTILYDHNNQALDMSLSHNLNVINPLPFYIGEYSSSPCDFRGKCCPLTYHGQAYRQTDNSLISFANGNVEILQIDQPTRQIYAHNQINEKRNGLSSENFVQLIKFKIQVQNGAGFSATQELKFKLVNCAQNPLQKQHNLAYMFDSTTQKTYTLAWQQPVSDLDASCQARVYIYQDDDTNKHENAQFAQWVKDTKGYLPSAGYQASFFEIAQTPLPPSIKVNPIDQTYSQFSRTWKMLVRTANGVQTGSETDKWWSDQQTFYLGICTLTQLTNNGVVQGQPLKFKNTITQSLSLQKSPTASGGSVCTQLNIAYSLSNAQSWMSLSNGTSSNTLNLALTTSVATGSYTFQYVMTYSTSEGTQLFTMHQVSYTITITVEQCNSQDWTFDSTWILLQPEGSALSNKTIAKGTSIILKTVFATDHEAICGVTQYSQSIKINDGNTENITNACNDFTSSCYGWKYQTGDNNYIEINLAKRTSTSQTLTVTVITTYYNAQVPIGSGAKKEWNQLTVIDCSLITVTEPDPWIVSGSYSIGSTSTVIRSEDCNCEKQVEVKNFSQGSQSVCNQLTYDLVTTDAAHQVIFTRVNEQNFTFNPSKAGTISTTLEIQVSLKVKVTSGSVISKAFTVKLYNCSTPVETAQNYYYAAMLGSSVPFEYEVTLPYTSTISYLECCNKFIYEFRTVKTTTASFSMTQPTWITLTNYNPITTVNGVNFKIKTSLQADAGKYEIKKSLMAVEKQAVTHVLHICIYQPQTPLFTNADATSKLVVLTFAHSSCMSFNLWSVIKNQSAPSCTDCTAANCGTAITTLSNYSFIKEAQTLTTSLDNGFKVEDDAINSKKKLCWNFTSVVAGGVHTMSYQITVPSQPNTQTFTKYFTLQLKSCNEFLTQLVDPFPWLKDKSANVQVPAEGAIIYFPAASLPQFELQSYSNNNFCDTAGTKCCSMTFVSSSVKTYYSTDSSTEKTGFMTTNIAVLTLLDTKVPEMLGSNAEASLIVKVTMNTDHLSFEKTFKIKFMNCAIPNQANLGFLINRRANRTFTLAAQNHSACTGIIRLRNKDGTTISHNWFSQSQSSLTTITIQNSVAIPIPDSAIADYEIQRYVQTINAPVQNLNRLDFKLSLCKLYPPTNNGVDQTSPTDFDRSDLTGTLKLAAGTVSPGAACRNINYSVSGLASWMTYNETTNSISLTNLDSAPQTYTFTYTLVYNDNIEPTYKEDFSITVTLVTCGFTVPDKWISNSNGPFEQDSQVSAVYTIKPVVMSSNSDICGTPTYTVSATMSTSEVTTSYVSISGLDVTVNLGARLSNLATFTMNVSVKIDIPKKSETKQFTINFFDCRIPSGTINALANVQMEIDEQRDFTDKGYQNHDIRCKDFKISFAFEQSPGSWFIVTTAGNPTSFFSYTQTTGQTSSLSFQLKPVIAVSGKQFNCKLIMTNRETKSIESSIFTVKFCKAQVSQAFLSPSSTVLTGNVFNLVRALTASEAKLQVQLSSAYSDPTQPLCTYTKLTIENLDAALMTVQSASLKETLVIDSFAWTSNGQVYSKQLEVKVWHNNELVWFATAPHTFTVKIYDCEMDMVSPTKWVVENPQFVGFSYYVFEEASGDHSLQITTPTRNYASYCGPLVYEISSTNASANANLVVNSQTGLITVKTPAEIYWGPEVVNIKIKNSYSTIQSSVQVKVFDCIYESISSNDAIQPKPTEMISTGPDWSYTWVPFEPSYPPCVIDTYDVQCEEGAYNQSSNLCSRGFQYNTNQITSIPAALNSKTIPPLTILAQYNEASQISVDHEGEFTIKIIAFKASTPTVKGSYSILLKIKTPCNNPLNSITTVTQTFFGNCRTANSKTFCDDIHYTVFTNQSNNIVPYMVRFAYSCKLTYELKLKQNGIESDVPSFITLKDSNGPVKSTTDPASLHLYSILNSDKDYSNTTLVLKASVAQFTQQTEYKLFIYNDCSSQYVTLNTGQTLNASFTVSQHLVTKTPTYLNFAKATAVQASDQKYCVIEDSGISLRQLNMQASITSSYNLKLFNLIPSQTNNDNKVEIKASNDDDVVSVVNNITQCDLGNISYSSCEIEFEIIATGKNGTYPLFATGKVDFKSECRLSVQYFQQKFSTLTDLWIWSQTDQTLFQQRYQVRKNQVTLNLPFVKDLPLASQEAGYSKNFKEACGVFVYSLQTIDKPFTLVQPDSGNTTPRLKVFTKDPLDANKYDPVNFARAYALDLRATNSKGQLSIQYADTQARKDALTYRIQDHCFGVTYEKPSLYYNDGRNVPLKTYLLEVHQPVLFDEYDVKFMYQNYELKNKEDPTGCGRLAYGGKHDGPPNVIKWGTQLKKGIMDQGDGLYFQLYTNENKYKGLYNVTYTAYLTDVEGSHLYPTNSSTIKVFIDDCYVKMYNASQPNLPNLVFNLYGKPIDANFKSFYQIPACNYTQKYNFTAFKLENGQVPKFEEGVQPDPNPFTFSGTTQRIWFETQYTELVNSTYQFFVTGHLSNSQQHQPSQVYNWGPFNAVILESKFLIDNTVPIISGLQPGYTVFKNETSTVTVGQIFDLESNKVSIVDWSTSDFANKWVKLSKGVDKDNLITVSFDIAMPAETSEQYFTIYLTLADNHQRKPLQVDYIVNFKINDANSDQTETSFIDRKNNQTKEDQYLKSLPPVGLPKSISISGGFVFEFDSPIEMRGLGNITSWNSTNEGQEYFRFELVPGDQFFYNDHDVEYQYTWNITNTTKTSITFQFAFNNYDVVSQRETDRMRFKILKPEKFISENSGKPTSFTSSLQSIPKQVRDIQEERQIQVAKDTFDGVLKALSGTSFVNILLSSSLQFLWGMINALQIIVLTVLFNLQTPVNTQQIEIMVLKMVSFDIFQTDKQLQKVFRFDLERNPPLNSKFEEAQYETSNFVLNMGEMFLVELIYLCFTGLVPLAKWLCIRQSDRIENYLKSVKLFNSFLRFYLESMLEISICTIMTFRLLTASTWKQPQLFFSNVWALGNLGILVVMPFTVAYIAMQFHKKFDSDWSYRRKYEDIFSELKGRSKLSMLYLTFFTLRRYAIALCLIAMPDRFLFQIYLQILSSSLFLLYILSEKPHKNPKQGKLEVFNELTVSAACYWLFIFTDLCPDSTRRYQAGWAKVGIILTNLLVNVSVMMVESFFEYKLKIKTWWIRRKLARMQQSRLQAQELQNQQVALRVNQRIEQPVQTIELLIQEPAQQSEVQIRSLEEAKENGRQQQIEEEFKRDHPQQFEQVMEERILLRELQKSLARANSRIPNLTTTSNTPQQQRTIKSKSTQPNNQEIQSYMNRVNLYRDTITTMNKTVDFVGNQVESDCQLVMPSSINQQTKQNLNQSPFEVIQEFNANQNRGQKRLQMRRQNRLNKLKAEEEKELEMVKNNKWLKSGATFLPSEPDWFYKEHPDYKVAKDYLDKKNNRSPLMDPSQLFLPDNWKQ